MSRLSVVFCLFVALTAAAAATTLTPEFLEQREQYFNNATTYKSLYHYWKRQVEHLEATHGEFKDLNDARDKEQFFATAQEVYEFLESAPPNDDAVFLAQVRRFQSCVVRHIQNQLFIANPCANIVKQPRTAAPATFTANTSGVTHV